MHYELAILGDSADAWQVASLAISRGHRTALVRPLDRDHSPEMAKLRERWAAVEWYLRRKPTHRFAQVMPAVAADRCSTQLQRLRGRAEQMGLEMYRGQIRLRGPQQIELCDGRELCQISADRVVLALGSIPTLTAGRDSQRHLSPEHATALKHVPATAIVLGQDRTSRCCAAWLAGMGIRITCVESDVMCVTTTAESATVRLANGQTVSAEVVVDCAHRRGATAELDLNALGLEPDEQGRLWCDDCGETWLPGVYAVGESVGYPQHLRDRCELPWLSSKHQVLQDDFVFASGDQKSVGSGATIRSGACVIG